LNNKSSLNTIATKEDLYEKISPPLDSNFFCWFSGGIILALNKVKHTIQGYTTPRTFSINDIARSITYDYSVVALWNHFLKEYCGSEYSIQNKAILELGPGADLGVGLILLSIGAKKYNSLDINNPSDNLKTEARRLTSLVELAAEEALLRSELIGIAIDENTYEFLFLEQTDWQPIQDTVFRKRTLPEDMQLELLTEHASEDNTQTELKRPDIVLLMSGEMTSFEVKLSSMLTDDYFRISGAESGALELAHVTP